MREMPYPIKGKIAQNQPDDYADLELNLLGKPIAFNVDAIHAVYASDLQVCSQTTQRGLQKYIRFMAVPLTLVFLNQYSHRAMAGGIVELTLAPAVFQGSEYRVFAAPSISWQEAYNHASVTLGPSWYLATSTSEQENAFIWQTIVGVDLSTGPRQYWLGGYPAQVGGFQWITGEPFTYQKWGGGEPSGDLSWQGHVTIGRFDNLFWNDEGAWPGGIRGFVVERSAVPEPATYAAMSAICLAAWGGCRRLRYRGLGCQHSHED